MTQEKLLKDILNVFNKKQEEYGDTDLKASRMIDILYPDGITPEKYDDFLFSLKILEKLSRLSSDNISYDSKMDLVQDIAGYGILGTYNKRVATMPKQTDNG
jgi:hypothetical protein